MGFFDDVCDWLKDVFGQRPAPGDGGLSKAVGKVVGGEQPVTKPQPAPAPPPVLPTKVAAPVVPAPRNAAEYEAKYNAAVIKPEHVSEAKSICARILTHKDQYDKVEKATGVPWFMVAAIHHMESDCDFDTHLHNGDPLTARTVHVPKGRPRTGTPPFAWYESAIDALGGEDAYHGDKWTIGSALSWAEDYNGRGYWHRGAPSPYLWSYTDQYTKGLYVSDGEYSATAVSKQCGVAAILKTLKAFQ